MSDGQLKVVTMQPGIIKDLTKYEAEGGWVDCDKIRFRASRPEKIGGWVRETISQSTKSSVQKFTGVSRAVLTWNSLDFKKYLAVASHLKIEIMYGNQIFDITPTRATVTLSNKITTVLGQSVVTINSTSHNLTVGDYIDVTTANTPLNGITLFGQYIVTVVVDSNNYKIDSGTIATGSTSGSGGTIIINYLLPSGQQNNGNQSGWGGGTWGTPGAGGGGWGEPRGGIGGVNLTQWSLDNWGEDLIACQRGGGIYQWVEDNGLTARAVQLTDSPANNLFVLVSQPSRYLCAFGSNVFATGVFDPLIIRWASEETLTDWDITQDNTAGEFRLPSGNYIVGAVQTRSEIVVFTDTDVYAMRFVGGNDVFDFVPLGTNTSTISQHAAIDVNGVVYWMGIDNFYMYDGVVHILPTTLDKYVFSQDGEGLINIAQKEKAYSGINKQFNEVWWFYPAIDSTTGITDNENGHYIKYNYMEQVWDLGTLNRTTWIDRSVFDKPYSLDENGILFVHETGKDADGQPLESFITTAYFDIADGNDFIFVNRIIPDLVLPMSRNIEITVFTKRYPHPGAEVTSKGPYFFDDNSTQISFRGRGRQMALEFRAIATGASFEIGKIRVGIQPDGERG